MISETPAIFPTLLAWITIEAIWNLFRRRLPLWFSIIPLVIGLICQVVEGYAWLAILIALSAFVTEVESRPLRVLGMAISILAMMLLAPGFSPLIIGWGMMMVLWEMRIIFGADALAGLSILIFFPSWSMVFALGVGLGMWAVTVLIAIFRSKAGLRLWSILVARAPGTAYPGIGGFVFGLAIYGLMAI